MEKSSIAFPNLGITLHGVGKNISIVGFEIAFYGMIIGLGILMGILVAEQEAKRTKQNKEIYLDYVIYAIVCAIIGARLYYVIFSWDMYKDDLLQIFNLRQGGLAIYGGVIGAVLTLIVYSRVKKQNFWLMADTGCQGLIVGQAIGRWGNFFNREAFGEYTDNLFAMKLPISAVRNGEITDAMREHMTDSCIQVHPTFLYESLWNVGVFLFLLFYRKRKHFDGELFFIYLGGYGLGRVWIESLRTDQLLIGSTGIAVSQVLAGCLVIVSAAVILTKNLQIRKVRKVAGKSEQVVESGEQSLETE